MSAAGLLKADVGEDLLVDRTQQQPVFVVTDALQMALDSFRSHGARMRDGLGCTDVHADSSEWAKCDACDTWRRLSASVTASQFEVFQCHCVVEGCSVEGDHWDADEEEEVVF
eukprot:COSAG05_NODE_867_length_6870_cov_8.177079_1_plen_113_part_00